MRSCARCGTEHEYRECGKEARPNGRYCGGNNSVAYSERDMLKREVEVQQVRVKEQRIIR